MQTGDGAAMAAAPLEATQAVYADSAAWLGANRLYPVPAVRLVPRGPLAQDGAAHGCWIALVVDMARVLGWPDPLPRVQAPAGQDSGAVVLAFAAPATLLGTAQTLNEWAWTTAAGVEGPVPASADPVAHLRAQAAAEAPSEPLAEPGPPPHEVPRLLVSGSNGKSTVVRLLGAMARAAGLQPGLLLSDGTDADASAAALAGQARALLRQPEVQTAVLELPLHLLQQHGLPVQQAQVALITQVGAEFFDPQARVADARAEDLLVLAHALAQGSALVMNGDDAAMLRLALALPHSTAPTWALFGSDHAAPLLQALRRHGGSTCAPRQGRLVLVLAGEEHDLGAVADMPLSLGGAAAQNTANLSAAALAAALAGWPLQAITQGLLSFGAAATDNPWRLQRRVHRGATVVLDSARDPDALAALLKLGAALGAKRIGLLLGAAGDSTDEALDALARCAAGFRPDRLVITPRPGQAAARGDGVVPLRLEQGLRAARLSSRALRHADDEASAARQLLEWARPGDVLLLPLHDTAARQGLLATLSAA